MREAQAERLQHALDAAVLAPLAMQGVEADVGLQLAEHLGHVAPGVDAADPGAQPLQGVGALAAGDQADLPFGGRPAHQNGDVLSGERRGHGGLNGL